ncbi:2OG-Fe(II) oxygenase family protein [Nostoc sp.]|uniref:2OG-Fe(II) oxygenase family protein n=1 Tax=Nostoc sp. TaxID=1180 RepID=UPI002FF8BAD1
MEKLSGLNLENHGMTVIFRRQHSKHSKFWLTHTDGQYTHLSHLFYFHKEWLEDWGGRFCVLSNNQPESVVREICPVINNSVAIVRSDNSWHMVTPVSPLATHHRLTMKTVFWATP